MKTSYRIDHVLYGCSPVPLAGYLKALGIFRLISEQIDPDAHGFWRDERFVLQTRLTEDELCRFFAENYQPSPLISPWNGRAGFLEGENEESDEKSSRQGAELIRLYESAGQRFEKLRKAVEIYRSLTVIKDLDKARTQAKLLQGKKSKKIALTEDEKSQLKELEISIKRSKLSAIGSLRSEAPNWAVDWLDACQRIGVENIPMPLLGSGGNDGSRDFGMSFGLAISELFDFQTGKPKTKTTALISESLGFKIIPGLGSGNLGQYEPRGFEENQTTGFGGGQPYNPVDFVFLLEGSVLFSGATTRRLGSNKARLSFPFTVKALTAGSGAAASVDDQNFAEFWAPLWERPTQLEELEGFLTEGRAAVDGKTAKDGLSFAVAVRTLGAQRGVTEYQRFALLQREPLSPKKATPLGRIRVYENSRASLVSELDAYGWLSRVRSAVRDKTAPPSFSALGRNLDEALFRLTSDATPEAAQEALICLGTIAFETGRRPKLYENLPPPPRLSHEWLDAADDQSYMFELAEALASLDASAKNFRLPFRSHLAPLQIEHKCDKWDDAKKTESQALAVWNGRDLLRDMAAILDRRLLEAQRHEFVKKLPKSPVADNSSGPPQLPLVGRWTRLASITTFIANDKRDDDRIAALTTGLAWVHPRKGQSSSVHDEDTLSKAEREEIIPFSYATLMPLFAPDGVGPEKRLTDPLPIVRLMRAGRVEHAIKLAQSMARGRGLPVPFTQSSQGLALPIRCSNPERLLAALLFPIGPNAQERLIERAYPSMKDEEAPDA